MNKKRLSLYFDTNVEIERRMWEYISQNGKNRKSYTLKKLLEKVIEEEEFIFAPAKVKPTIEEPTVLESSDDDIDDIDLPF